MAYGCKDDDNGIEIDCVHGEFDGSECVCNGYYTINEAGACTLCVPGYEERDGVCEKLPEAPIDCVHGENQENTCICEHGWKLDSKGLCTEKENCVTTLVYRNCAERGQEFYLTGQFNSQENEKDERYKFSETDGIYTLVVDDSMDTVFSENSTVNFGISRVNAEDGTLVPVELSDYASCSSESGTCSFEVGSCGNQIGIGEHTDKRCPCVGDDCSTCEVTFVYENKWSAGFDVYLVGDFNTEDDKWILKDPNYIMQDEDGKHTISVNFKEGESIYYQFYVDGWKNESIGTDDGLRSDHDKCVMDNCRNTYFVDSCGQTVRYIEKDDDAVCNMQSEPEESKSCLKDISIEDKTITISTQDDEACVISGVTGGSGNAENDEHHVTDTVSENNRYQYRITLENQDELYVPVWVEDKPFDWHDAVMYYAITDRFNDGDPSNNNPSTDADEAVQWKGGDFAGLKDKVDNGYFDALGVNTLWISSVSMNVAKALDVPADSEHHYSAYHSFWPLSTFMTADNQDDFPDLSFIDSHFGTNDELAALVDACHKKGIRVVVDFVPNHVHVEHPFYTKHPEWFNDSNVLCTENHWADEDWVQKCWLTPDLADFDYTNAEVRQLMIDHAKYLIETTHIDGFRISQVKHVAPQFIQDLRKAIDDLFENSGIRFYLFGDVFSGDAGSMNRYIADDMLHAQLNYPLYFSLTDVLKGNGFDKIQHYKDESCWDLMGMFIGNPDLARPISIAADQDTGRWAQNPAVTDADAYDNLKAAWTILFTRPGIPVVYYGDEYGQEGANNPDNRRMMVFGDALNDAQKATLAFVQKLGNVRQNYRTLRYGKRRNFKADKDNWCYVMELADEPSVLVGIATKDGEGCDFDGVYDLKDLLNGDEQTGVKRLSFVTRKIQLYEAKKTESDQPVN